MTTTPAPLMPFGRIGYMIVGAPPDQVVTVADTLERELARVGWTRVNSPPATPANPAGTQMERGSWKIDLRTRLAEVAVGVRSPEQWQEACRVAGIDVLQIEVPIFNAAPERPVQSTFNPLTQSGSEGRKIPSGIFFVALALILTAFVRPLVRDNPQHGSSASNSSAASADKPTYITADGKSNLAGRYATASYPLSGHDWESTQAPTNQDGPFDGAEWWLGQYLSNSMLHFGMDHRVWNPPIVTSKDEADFVTKETGYMSETANGTVKTDKTVIDGRKAYTWELTSRDGKWIYEARVLARVHSYRFTCVDDQPTPENLIVAKSRCDAFFASVKFHDSN